MKLASGMVMVTIAAALGSGSPTAVRSAGPRAPEDSLVVKGRRTFEAICSACHSLLPPPKQAPPMAQVAHRYRLLTGSRPELIERISAWVANPQADRSLLPPQALRHWNLMPALPLQPDDLRAVGHYVAFLAYDTVLRPGLGRGRMGMAPEPDATTAHQDATVPSAAEAAPAGRESVFYLVDARDALESFERHAAQVSIVGPQSFRVDSLGNLAGQVPPRVLEIARRNRVAVMPLIVNPGWNLELFHRLVNDAAARARMVERMVELGRRDGYWGWQFDFEQIHVGDRDALTRFYREAADALHANGMKLSIAVYPDPGELTGGSTFHTWLSDYLIAAYDLKALADIGDFISLMTYLQHTPRTPPGPVGGLPYLRRVVERALGLGIPADKLSLGVPFFSMHWYTEWSEERKGYSWSRGLAWQRARALIDSANASEQWDSAQGSSWARWEKQGTFEHAWLEDARALAPKLELQQRYGLRGISVWRIGQEDPAVWPVLERWAGGAAR